MSNVFNLPSQDSPDEVAGHWISKINRGLTESEESEYRAWVASDQRNRNAMMTLSALWDEMEDLSRLSDLFPEEGLTHTQAGFGKRTALLAASLATILGVGFFLNNSYLHSDSEKSYETSVGELSTVSLPDGSELVLNTNSLVKVTFHERHRLVTLVRGELHIDVAHDESRPLSVKAGTKVVQAVGTAFNIELYANQKFELIVTDGEVRVGDLEKFERVFASIPSDRLSKNKLKSAGLELARLPEESISVSQGERIVFGKVEQSSGRVAEVADDEISTTLSWQRGNLVFNGESLEEVINEIGRYTSTGFQFESDEIKGVRIAGTFKAGDIDGLLIALNDTFDVSTRKLSNNRISLYRDL